MRWARYLSAAALVAGTSLALSAAAETRVPASMTMKVYRFGVSTSPTCENMTIFTLEAPDYVDFTTNPTLGTAAVPDGTYHCVALEVDPVMTVAPRVAQGACTTAPVTIDTCQGFAIINSAPQGAEILDGVQPLGADASKVFKTCPTRNEPLPIYLTTQVATAGTSNPYRPPTSASDTRHGHPLGAPLVVGPNTTGTFVVSLEAYSTDAGQCFTDNAVYSFESTGGS